LILTLIGNGRPVCAGYKRAVATSGEAFLGARDGICFKEIVVLMLLVISAVVPHFREYYYYCCIISVVHGAIKHQ